MADNKYRVFFVDSPEGKIFVDGLKLLIDDYHAKAEKDPEHARDYTQRACGIRDVVLKISSMSVDSFKGRATPAESLPE